MVVFILSWAVHMRRLRTGIFLTHVILDRQVNITNVGNRDITKIGFTDANVPLREG